MSILSDPCCIALIALAPIFLIAALVRWLRAKPEKHRGLNSQSPAPTAPFTPAKL